jgi:hypothetical protein
MFRYGPGNAVARPGKAAGCGDHVLGGHAPAEIRGPPPGGYGAAATGAPPRAIGGIGARARYGRPAAMVTRLLVAVFT